MPDVKASRLIQVLLLGQLFSLIQARFIAVRISRMRHSELRYALNA